jgi:3-oxoadipate enol-lactonase
MPALAIDGEDFNVEVSGKEGAPWLVFSNSLSSNLSMWDPQMAAAAARFRVLRYDSRGHGRSVANAGPYSVARLANDALAIMDRLGIASAHWCGLSKGGMVGQWLLTHAPHRIGRAILANTAARMPPPELWNGRMRNARANGMAALVEPTLQRWFTPEFIAAAPATMDAVRAMVAATPVEGYCGCCAAIRDMDQTETIRAIRNPVLLIAGDRDPATTPAMMRLLHERIPGSGFLSLPASHISNIECADGFTGAMMEFLA